MATLKSPYEDQVLTKTQFEEQKYIILSGLKKITITLLTTLNNNLTDIYMLTC